MLSLMCSGTDTSPLSESLSAESSDRTKERLMFAGGAVAKSGRPCCRYHGHP